MKINRVSRAVLCFVRDQFEVTEAEVTTVEAIADNRKDVTAFNDVSVSVINFIGNAILPFCFSFDLLASQPLSVGVEIPVFDNPFDGLVVPIVGDL